jgi:hypothetical protein
VLGGGDGLPLEVADGADPFRPKQLVTADVHATEQDERDSHVDLDDRRRGEGGGDVDAPRRQVVSLQPAANSPHLKTGYNTLISARV